MLLQMLVVFKSAPILKRTLKVKHALLQLYVLKLLKMQTKYLGRQWRKSNMKTMSAIYQKVRHRLNDDWAFGNGELFSSSFPLMFLYMISSVIFCVLRFSGFPMVMRCSIGVSLLGHRPSFSHSSDLPFYLTFRFGRQTLGFPG